jgi:ferrochelatase
MSFYNKEPKYTHGDIPKIGIILANLGTPEKPTSSALRKYLQQFLMDRRVVEIPRFIWCWILHFIILVFRPNASAKKYASIWTKKGSPLYVNLLNQSNKFKEQLKKNISTPLEVEIGMSYGKPSVAEAIDNLKKKNCTKILFFPLYPQYASSSTGAALDALFKKLIRTRNIPEIRVIRNYHDDPSYINALEKSIRNFWATNGKPKKLIMSFHGVPKKSLMDGDPYHCECHKTARLLATKLKLKDDEYIVCFQSRFGKAEWLKPYFAKKLEAIASEKNLTVNVICPGFSSDCLETLEEINMEGREIFIENGGDPKGYSYIPALNDNPEWIDAMIQITSRHLSGWIKEKYNANDIKKLSNITKLNYKKIKDKL